MYIRQEKLYFILKSLLFIVNLILNTCVLYMYIKMNYRTNQVNFKLFHAIQISLSFCLCCCLSAVNGSTRMIFASCDTYYTLGKYTEKKSEMSTALNYTA